MLIVGVVTESILTWSDQRQSSGRSPANGKVRDHPEPLYPETLKSTIEHKASGINQLTIPPVITSGKPTQINQVGLPQAKIPGVGTPRSYNRYYAAPEAALS